jgi:hypothetical protein
MYEQLMVAGVSGRNGEHVQRHVAMLGFKIVYGRVQIQLREMLVNIALDKTLTLSSVMDFVPVNALTFKNKLSEDIFVYVA